MAYQFGSRNSGKKEYTTIGSLVRNEVPLINWFEKGKETTIRVLNPLDQQGNESPTFNMDLKTQYVDDRFGNAFCKVETTDIFIRDKAAIFKQCTAQLPVDRDGVQHGSDLSPLTWFIISMQKELSAAALLIKKGYPSHVPMAWHGYRSVDRATGKPRRIANTHLLLQVLASTVNNEPVINEAGQNQWQWRVIALPSALKSSLAATMQMPSAAPGGALDMFSAASGHKVTFAPVDGTDPNGRGGVRLAFNTMLGEVVPLGKDFVNSAFIPWEKVVNAQHPEEQIEDMLSYFEPEFVGYMLGNHPVWGNTNPEHKVWLAPEVLEAGSRWEHSVVQSWRDLEDLPVPGQPTGIPFPKPPIGVDLSLYTPRAATTTANAPKAMLPFTPPSGMGQGTTMGTIAPVAGTLAPTAPALAPVTGLPAMPVISAPIAGPPDVGAPPVFTPPVTAPVTAPTPGTNTAPVAQPMTSANILADAPEDIRNAFANMAI